MTLRKEKYLSIWHSDDVGVKANRIKLLDNRDCMSHLALAEEGFSPNKVQFHLLHLNSRSHSESPFSIPFLIAVWSPGTLWQSFLWPSESPGAFSHHTLGRDFLFPVPVLQLQKNDPFETRPPARLVYDRWQLGWYPLTPRPGGRGIPNEILSCNREAQHERDFTFFRASSM